MKRDKEKIEHVILYILNKFNKEIKLFDLYKILYISQYQHLIRWGRGVIKDDFYVFNKYIISENVHNIIFRNKQNFEITTINEDKYILSLNKNTDLDHLSISDREIIDSIIENKKYNDFSFENDELFKLGNERGEIDPEKRFITTIEIAKYHGADDSFLDYLKEGLEMDLILNF